MWLTKAPLGTRVLFKGPRRSVDQNSRLWAMLTDVASQKEHCGRKYSADVWKTLFMHAWQKEIDIVPALDGRGVVPLTRTSDLSKAELSELMEFIASWGVQEGVVFHDDQVAA